jgi:signal transduction histidine kinase
MSNKVHTTMDSRWPKLLSLTVHEFRTPLTVVAGYIRMLLKDRAGPLTDPQRRLLEEAERSCSRLSGLLAEMSELSALEGATAAFNLATLDLRVLLREGLDGLPPLPDRSVQVELSAPAEPLTVSGDPTRLRQAFSSVIVALRRELVESDRLLVQARAQLRDGALLLRITIAEPPRVDKLAEAAPDELAAFDEWRGGCGLSLANARRVIEAHGGLIWSPREGPKAAAVIQLPGLCG